MARKNDKEHSDQMQPTATKSSFAPISNPTIEILILGSLPGDKSIELNEYYGHPRNRLWKILATISHLAIPENYNEKLALINQLKIGLWDVANNANRTGSLDSAIKHEEPNDLDNFIIKHPKLKIIAFNGKTSEALFNKYFEKKNTITYLSLPSTSPANARFTFEKMCEAWQAILQK
ncbi:DNA-deoxyinosine glycosylase [Flavobacterium algicola]|uniref:DNA-deoxyinosine glycosylase n=1 Tax=Flavobacterium algicola TaxID=556529 RepID=UPI001EFD996D|nr:DNA-deoxyinosine glycosylase [Flavobacterium algicola]MCG9791058.1 DNA-deoxyinosine glycosylase [Flavobacterium algicola]